MILIIRRSLNAISWDKPLSGWRIVAGIGLRLSDVVALYSRSDIIGIDRMAIVIAAAFEMKHRIGLARVPTVSARITSQYKAHNG
ncbi:hypothetical protein [Mesorhizobium humile]|jgi:hypothetical protein|uniref:hypothetical protein n=1 Tax=Mesorhizobium humile TaxID=3072313 RepID=UPI002A24A846|nr:hypothetical protein [Mesorhizobium sp. VK2D]MDX8458303.1 hypothetical protein [Mesorhizobium sp. VK2D]